MTGVMSWTLDKKYQFSLPQVLQWFEYKDRLFLASRESRPDDEEESTSDSSTNSIGIAFFKKNHDVTMAWLMIFL